MSEWTETTLKQLINKVIDNRGKNPPYSSDGHEVIETSCISGNSKYPDYSLVKKFVDNETYKHWFRSGHPQENDLLFITVGNGIGSVAIMNENRGVLTQNLIGLRFNDKGDSNFYYYYLQQEQIQEFLKSLNIGSAQPSLKVPHIMGLEVPYPPLQEQKTIALVFSSLDDKIALLHRQNKTLEAMAETLFRQWFVEEADRSWELKQLGEYIEVMRGLSYNGAGLAEVGNGIPMHNLNSVYEGGGYKYEGIKYYSGEFRERHKVNPGDVIVTNTEQGHDMLLIGFPAIVPKCFGDSGIFSQHVYRLRIKDDLLTETFLYYLLMTYDVREQIIGATNGSTVNMLAKDGIEWARFRLPPRSKIKEFTEIINPFIERKETNYLSIQSLEKLRDNLLSKLMSGEVKINYEC